jgi:aspartyl-tRNA(Asn)/glutamyl-tRNA(Gln) amidotransferase subunit B
MTEVYLDKLHGDKLLPLIADRKVTNSEVQKLIDKAFEGEDILPLLEEAANKQQMDASDVDALIDKIINDNPQLAEDIANRPDRAQKFIMGQLMKETKGQVNPKEANQAIAKKLNA